MEIDIHPRAACSRQEALLADYLSGDCNSTEAVSIEAHLQSCPNCRAAFDDAQASERLLRAGLPLLERSPEPRPEFARNVMARIRLEKDASAAERIGFWQPVISFGWRFAATAMLALVILLAYAVGSRSSRQRSASAGQVPLADVFAPDPTSVPANQDEILIMVAETDHSNDND
jgi:anti-sigma factor RsiW